MKIGIVGVSDSVKKIYKLLSQKYKEVEFVLAEEERIENMLERIQDISTDVDGIYLTGIGVYYSLINSRTIDVKKPVCYVKRGSIGLIKSFWDFQKDKTYNIKDNLKIGIDVVSEKIFLEVIKEFEIDIKDYYYQKYDSDKTEEEYLENYLKKYKKGEINCVFTAFGYIYNFLVKNSIPAYRIQATDMEIEDEFISLLNNVKYLEDKSNKIGVKILKVFSGEKKLYKNNLKNKLEVEKELLEYSKEVEGNLQVCDENEYMIISNIELLKSRENLNKIFKLKEMLKNKDGKLAVGIGEGNTLFQAERNARKALKLSFSKNEEIFLFDGESVRGPLLAQNELEYKNISDEKIEKISNEIGVSSLYLEKIKSIMKRQNKDSFTSEEISGILNITQRSVNRILKKIIEKNYAENIRTENSLTAGRPKRIIKFYF